MRLRLLILISCSLAACASALADDLQESYKRGYKEGFRDAMMFHPIDGGGRWTGGGFGGARTEGWVPGVGGTEFDYRVQAAALEEILKNMKAYQQPGAVVLPGQNFNTTILPNAASKFSVPADSSVAIIPNSSLGEIQQKLGADFLKEGMVLNNGMAPTGQ